MCTVSQKFGHTLACYVWGFFSLKILIGGIKALNEHTWNHVVDRTGGKMLKDSKTYFV